MNEIRPGTALCLSGGGYRALLFHLGAIKRINELGLLYKLDRISSVSAGSILAGYLGIIWDELNTDSSGIIINLDEKIIDPLLKLTSVTIDIGVTVKGLLSLGMPGYYLEKKYASKLFDNKRLQDFPDKPRIVLCSTNLQSGVFCRFSKPYMWDYRIGQIKTPNIPVALAVAASSAFPPFLSPVIFNTQSYEFTNNTGLDLEDLKYRKKIYLTDGGVYDNLALESVKNFETILVSDGSRNFSPLTKIKCIYLNQLLRSNTILQAQIRNLRLRKLINDYNSLNLRGAYWGISININNYEIKKYPQKYVNLIHNLSRLNTRLYKMSEKTKKHLLDYGYNICKISLEKYFS